MLAKGNFPKSMRGIKKYTWTHRSHYVTITHDDSLYRVDMELRLSDMNFSYNTNFSTYAKAVRYIRDTILPEELYKELEATCQQTPEILRAAPKPKIRKTQRPLLEDIQNELMEAGDAEDITLHYWYKNVWGLRLDLEDGRDLTIEGTGLRGEVFYLHRMFDVRQRSVEIYSILAAILPAYVLATRGARTYKEVIP